MPATKQAVPVTAGPHEFTGEITIDRSAAEVYPLLDFADPRHAKRQLGERVEALGESPRRFALTVSELSDVAFTVTVTHEAEGREYGFTCEASEQFGKVVESHEHYALHPEGPQSCRIVLTQTVTFDGPLDEQTYAMEAMMLSFASFGALSKLKLHAEEGTAAVRALMADQQAMFGDPD